MQIIGHEKQRAYLEWVLRNQRFAHAYLLYGPEEIGKRTIAMFLAKSLHCAAVGEQRSMADVCGWCAACVSIDAGTHPHIFLLPSLVAGVEQEDQRDISIADIRELKHKFSFAPSGSGCRVAIIDGADAMTTEAASAFLKLLEEPGQQSLFLLIARARESLFETIVSRTVPLRFMLVPDAVLRQAAEESGGARPASEVAELLEMAAGRPGRLVRLLGERTEFEREQKFSNIFKAVLRRGSPADAIHLAERVAGSRTLRRKTQEYLFSALRKDLLNSSICGKIDLSMIRRVQSLCAIAEEVETTNVNSRLAMEAMFFKALEGRW